MSTDAKIRSCPAAHDRPAFPDFDPLTPDHVRDPWPLLARARQEQPVFWMPQLQMYCVTRYDDIRKIHDDPETFANAGANLMRVPIPEGIQIPPGCPFPGVGEGVANQDGASHTRLRSLMQPAFRRARLAEFVSQLEQIANDLIDHFIADGEADLVTQFANPMAVRSIALVLGFPETDAVRFREWTDQFIFLMATPNMSDSEARRLWTGLIEWYQYIKAMVESRRKMPQNDLVSDLMTPPADRAVAPLTDSEIIANIIAFIAAGTDTTAIFITQTIRLLHSERLWEKVRDDRSRLERVMEECLRYVGVVRGLNRVVIRDTELSGVKIPAGSVLYWMAASANRDPAKFADPERFDPDRKALFDHVAFSGGRHFCIGAPLARLESKIALNSIMDRLPTLRVPDQVVEFHPNFLTPAPVRVQIEWTADRDLRPQSS